jgi:hypothetical protein
MGEADEGDFEVHPGIGSVAHGYLGEAQLLHGAHQGCEPHALGL